MKPSGLNISDTVEHTICGNLSLAKANFVEFYGLSQLTLIASVLEHYLFTNTSL